MSDSPLSPQDSGSFRPSEKPTEAVPITMAPRTALWRTAVLIPGAILFGPAVVLLAGLFFAAPADDPFGWKWFAQNRGASIAAILVSCLLGWFALKRDWARRSSLWKWNLAVVGMLVLAVIVVPFPRVRRHQQDQSIRGQMRQLSVIVDRFFNDNPYRIFVSYEEVVGPARLLKQIDSLHGEDYRPLFPIRRNSAYDEWSLILPGGRKIDFPGQAAPIPDGVRKQRWSDGRRFETTYRNGMPDGPFRAYLPDGTLWGEATYAQGRLVGPAWLVTRDGRKFNEITEGAAGQAAFLSGAASSATPRADQGRKKHAAGDFRGAIADLTQAIKANPADLSLYRSRGDARLALKDLDGAIRDYLHAESVAATVGYDFPDYLSDLLLERGRRRLAAGDPQRANEDFRAGAHSATSRARQSIRQQDFAGATKTLGAVLAVAPFAELHDLRGDARRILRDYTGAEADYTRALALDAEGTLLLPANHGHLAGSSHYKRGHVRRWAGNLSGAAEDFHTAIPLVLKSTQLPREAPAVWLFFVQCEQGDRTAALAELARNLPAHAAAGQHRLPVCLLLGEITADQLDTAVTNPNYAYYLRPMAALYAGLLLQLSGDHAAAQTRFRTALSFRNVDEILHQAAQFALERSQSTGIKAP